MRTLTIIVGAVVMLLVLGDEFNPTGDVLSDPEKNFWKKSRRKREDQQETHRIRHGHNQNLEHIRRSQRILRCRRYISNYAYVKCSTANCAPTYYRPPPCQSYCNRCPRPMCRKICPYKTTSTTFTIPYTSVRPPQRPCECDKDGSLILACDPNGKCRCKDNFAGDKCDRCKDEFWKKNSSCEPCECNRSGSIDATCDKNGNCHCKEGVTGKKCDKCDTGYYETSHNTCLKCDPCPLPGHICDPHNGRCVCPPNTEGDDCSRCKPNTWGYEPGIGCKPCTCYKKGTNHQCDKDTGACTCKHGYMDANCSSCMNEFHKDSMGNCVPCNCDSVGSTHKNCTDAGVCFCKEYVTGPKCNKCKPATFGLYMGKETGCTKCFCFGRSKTCEDSNYNWMKLVEKGTPTTDCRRGSYCLKLPFVGDLTTSYGGYLSIEPQVNFRARIKNAKHIVIGNYDTTSTEVRLDEGKWRIEAPNKILPKECHKTLNRDCLMVVLQNVTEIIIELSEKREVTMHLDKSDMSYPVASTYHTVEKCKCPAEYTGLSCQDPNKGYFRSFPTSASYIPKIIGVAKRCECSGNSDDCDPNTGHCKDCRNNTSGEHCENCAPGYYRDKEGSGACLACQCPSATQNNAVSCEETASGYVCNCKEGYKRPRCEECEVGYYKKGTKCEPCGCNNATTARCNEMGECECKPGFGGPKCDECESSSRSPIEKFYVKDGECKPCDQCTQLLFKALDELDKNVTATFHLFDGGIGPPWDELTDKVQQYNLLSDKYAKLKERLESLIKNADLDSLEESVDYIGTEVDQYKNELNTDVVKKLYEQTETLKIEINKAEKSILKIIRDLKLFNTEDVDVKDALRKATDILKKIKQKHKELTKIKYEPQLKRCNEVIKEIDKIYGNPITNPNKLIPEIHKLIVKLKDLKKINEDVNKSINIAEGKNIANKNRYNELMDVISKMYNKSTTVDKELDTNLQKLSASSILLEQTTKLYESLVSVNDALHESTASLRKRRTPNKIDIDELIEDVEDHVDNLNSTLEEYRELFNFTTDEWRKINASVAYGEIVTQIKQLRKISLETKDDLEMAWNVLAPDGGDSVVVTATLSKALSDRLKHRIKNMKQLTSEYKNVRNDVEKLKYNIKTTGRKNNDLNAILNEMGHVIGNRTKNTLEVVIGRSENISDHIHGIIAGVANLNLSFQYSLKKDFQKYLNLTSKEEIDKFKKQITDFIDVNSNGSLLDEVNEKLNKHKLHNTSSQFSQLSQRIKDLRGLIKDAQHLSDGLPVYLNLTDCRRSYVPTNEFFGKFGFTFTCESCPSLMSIQIGETSFLNFSATSGKINITFKSKSIDFVYYHNCSNIQIIRNGQNLNIVHNQKEVKTIEDVFEISDNIRNITVGFDKSINTGTLFAMKYNKETVGLWNFKTTDGFCAGAKEECSLSTNNTKIEFWNGRGYGKGEVTKGAITKVKEIALTFEFKTFDENSLIYYSEHQEDNQCKYMVLYLKDGQLHYSVKNNDTPELVLPTRVNDGQLHKVEILSIYNSSGFDRFISLKLNEETPLSLELSLEGTKIYRFKVAQHYLAGLPASFVSCNKSIEMRSFLGVLKESSRKLEFLRNYGKLSNEKFEFSKAWLRKSGSLDLEYSSVKTNNINQLSFYLRPYNNANGLVMDLAGVKISLRDKLIVESNKKQITLEPIQDDEYNYVMLNFNNNIVSLNDIDHELPIKPSIPSDLNIKFITNGFTGGFYNLLLNGNEKLYLNETTVRNFKNVDIGRELPKKEKRIRQSLRSGHHQMDAMMSTETCASFTGNVPEKAVANFGDKTNSYVKIISVNLKKHYKISLQFRTFYPDGMLLFAEPSNNRKGHYMLLELRDGKVHFKIKSKREKVIVIPNVVNDGEWHTLTIKKNPKLTIVLDMYKQTSKVPNINIRPHMYLGDIPIGYPGQNVVLRPFRGCIKNFKYNDTQVDLLDNKNSKNIGGCFSKVERGAYFSGDSYVIYKRDFQVSKILDLRFEFRTSEPNGILLSVSNPGNSPALSIELQNGAVVMAIDKGNGKTNNVSNNLNSDVALCNNKWHNVTASYSGSELTVNIDGIVKTWVQSDSNTDEINAPLYIGGIADNAPTGTLKVVENFKGCIRNIMVRNDITDWTDMEERKNVMLNSCPISN